MTSRFWKVAFFNSHVT